MTNAKRCGYFILCRSPLQEDAPWEPFSGEVHPLSDAAEAEADAQAARDWGYDALICSLVPRGNVLPAVPESIGTLHADD